MTQDEVAEWLRRWTANPLGSPRVGSNPILVDYFFPSFFHKFITLNKKQIDICNMQQNKAANYLLWEIMQI